jgi:hypothetical protein
MTAAIANVIIDWDEKAVGIARSLGRIDPPGQCVTKSGKKGRYPQCGEPDSVELRTAFLLDPADRIAPFQ